MGKLARNFEELLVYRKAFDLQQEVFKLSKTFPSEEKFSLTDQIRRSSRSIGANIAESWKKRRYAAHFISKLSDADSELAETVHWLSTAFSCSYLSESEYGQLLISCTEIGKMIGSMMNNSSKWCENLPETPKK